MSVASWTIAILIVASVLLAGAGPAPVFLLPALGAAALAGVALFDRSLRPLSGTATGVLLVWTALALLEGVAASRNGADAFPVVAVLTGLCAFAVCHAAVPRSERERLLAILGVAGALVAALALWSTTPGEAASFPLATPDRLAGWLVLPALVGVAALWLCAPEGRGAGWTIAWFCAVALCAAAIAASRSVAALAALGVAVSTLLALRRLPWRRGFTAAVALCGLALVSLAPALGGSADPGFSEAGFAPGVHGTQGFEAFTRVAALLLSAAVALRGVRPLRRGRGSLAAWAGAGAVFCVAPLGLLDAGLDVPAIALTAAVLAGLAWPAPRCAQPGDVRRTRAVLLLVAGSVAGALLAGAVWRLGPLV